MSCDKYRLDKDIEFCDNPITGVKSMILINEDDLQSVTFSQAVGKENIVSAISLITDARAYKVTDGRKKNPLSGSGHGHEDSDYGSFTPKTIQFEILDNGAEGALLVDKLQEKYIAVLELANGEFEIVGYYDRLTISDKSKTLTGTEQLGWLVTMTCTELTAGLFFLDTDGTTTKAAYEALYAEDEGD